jgi:ABC-type multidrug transport system ATPase subunit
VGDNPVPEPVVEVEGLVKTFRSGIRALDGLSLAIPAGSIYGLLGPNGAGKTTLIRVLTTLLPPDAGRARVAGIDVTRDPAAVRARIGLAGQSAAVDDLLTGRENVEMVGRLYGLGPREARRRATEVLERIRLSDRPPTFRSDTSDPVVGPLAGTAGRYAAVGPFAESAGGSRGGGRTEERTEGRAADRPVRTYSGGMRRRLDLAASLVGRPRVLFLDEPTTGLDPASRRSLWATIRELVAEGTTVLLTTQYLEEADQLADRIVVLDRGRVIAEGTADELKARAGGQVVQVRPDGADLDGVAVLLSGLGGGDVTVDQAAGLVTLPAPDPGIVAEVVRRLDAAGVAVADLALRRPSLDDVFLRLTGHTAEASRVEGARDEERVA